MAEKHTGEPDAGLALPFDMEPRKGAIAFALILVFGVFVLPFLYLVATSLLANPAPIVISFAALVVAMLFAVIVGRLVYYT